MRRGRLSDARNNLRMRIRPSSALASWGRVVLAILPLFGCANDGGDQSPPATVLGGEPAEFVSARNERATYALTTSPTSGVVVTGERGAVCFSYKGEELWRFEAADGEELLADPAIAPDGSVFLLTSRSLVSLSPAGQVVWTMPVEPGEIPAVVALGDGSAAVTSGSSTLVDYRGGAVQWRFELPDNDTITAHPEVASNSRIFVQGRARLYVIDPAGFPVWDKPL